MLPRLLHRFSSACCIASLVLATTACTIQMPAAPAPEPVVPAVATQTPRQPETSRLVVDVVEGPTVVQRTLMQSEPVSDAQGRTSYRFYETYDPLCDASPCVLDVPAGTNVLLGFPVLGDSGGLEVELVHVGPEPSVYRRSLSYYERNRGALQTLGIIATSLGGTSAMTGVSLLPVGLGKDHDGLALAGGITLAAGAVLIAAGVWAIRHDASRYRPGSSLHFSF